MRLHPKFPLLRIVPDDTKFDFMRFRRISFPVSAALSIVAILLFFGLFAYAPGWGEFHKPHELNASLVIAILWMTVVALDDPASNRRIWLAATASATTAAIIISVNIGAFLGFVFASFIQG